jgi:putative Holliday junction resolvase
MMTKDLQLFFSIISKERSLLAVDYGTKKTGIAISDPGQKISLPLCTILESDQDALVLKINELLLRKKIGGIVIGLPLTQDNSRALITEKAEKLALQLENENNPVLLYDERFSSKAARNLLKIHGIAENSIRETNDQIAAFLMLSEILESRR